MELACVILQGLILKSAADVTLRYSARRVLVVKTEEHSIYSVVCLPFDDANLT